MHMIIYVNWQWRELYRIAPYHQLIIECLLYYLSLI